MRDRTILDLYRNEATLSLAEHYVHHFPGGSRAFSCDQLLERMIALLLLLATNKKASQKAPLEDIDLKRGQILLHNLISD